MEALILFDNGTLTAVVAGVISLILLKWKPAVLSTSLKDFDGITIAKSILFIAFLIFVFLGIDASEISYPERIRWNVLFYIVAFAGWIDLERNIIPNGLIIFGLAVWVLLSVFTGWDMTALFAGISLLMLLYVLNRASVYFFEKNGMGFGDLKLCFVIILLAGLEGFWLIGLSVLTGGLFAMAGIVLQQLDRKSYLPFAPFLTLGVTTGYFLVSWEQTIGFLWIIH